MFAIQSKVTMTMFHNSIACTTQSPLLLLHNYYRQPRVGWGGERDPRAWMVFNFQSTRRVKVEIGQ